KPKVVDGRYTGDLDFYAYGPQKAEAIEKLAAELDIDLDGSFAYTDSTTDLPMLSAVGHPVAVNPDRALRRLAIERGWAIEVFRNPVSLRSRLPQLPTVELTRSNVTAAGAVAAVGLVTWWLTKKAATRRAEHA
ncbi:MAG: HAD family hydrolase, partial [Actinomycetota bacterium]